MIAVIFEVYPAEGKVQEYLDIAAELRPLLENIDGLNGTKLSLSDTSAMR